MADNEHKYTTISSSKMYSSDKDKSSTIIIDETLRNEHAQKDDIKTNFEQQVVLNSVSRGSSLFGAIILILIGVCLIRILYSGSNVVSFADLLDLLGNVPQFSNNVKDFVQIDFFNEPWDYFDGIRIILKYFTDGFSVFCWISSCILEMVLFLMYFIYWLFV